jgi:hypothetical protein
LFRSLYPGYTEGVRGKPQEPLVELVNRSRDIGLPKVRLVGVDPFEFHDRGSFTKDELAHPLVVEYNRDATRTDVNGHPVPHDQGIRIIHLEAIPVHQYHRKRSVWASLLKGVQSLVEAIYLHLLTPMLIVAQCTL